jgi:uncharacterized protein involved in type VI secretion and phage assembly
MAQTQAAQRLTFKVDGTAADDQQKTAIEEIVIDATMGMPSMARIHLNDDMDLSLIAGATFKIGATLDLLEDKDSGKLIFKGEITALEADFSDDGRALLIVHAYDKSHRLHRGKKSRTFLKQSDGQIVKQIAQEAGLKAGTIEDGIQHEFMLQSNQTNMEWLLMRAERLDYQFYVDIDEKLHFQSADKTRGAVPDLTWGANLISFRPRITTSHQVDKVTSYGWDPKTKKKITGMATPNGNLKPDSIPKTGGAYAKASFGAASTAILADVVENADAAKLLAQGLANTLSGEFAFAEGVCYGNAEIVVGGKVNVKITDEAKSQFSGKYLVTSLQQIFRVATGQWNTHFIASGRRPDSLQRLVGGGAAQNQYNDRFMGVVPAIVTNFQDPDNLGRVKVAFPWMMNEEKSVEIESDWIRIATPFAGAERGFQFIPEVNDEVLVAFEHGNATRPYIIGCLWNGKDKPPLPNSKVNDKSNITQRLIKSRSGHLVILDDTKGSEQIIIRDKSEKNEIVIDTKSNSINIKCDKNISLDAGGDITLSAKGKVSIESTADTTIAANAKFAAEGKAGVEIKGATAKVEAQAQLQLKANGPADLQGAVVNVKGNGMVNVQGGIIKLN